MSDPASALEIFLDELARRVALMVAAGAVEDLITAAPSTQTSLNALDPSGTVTAECGIQFAPFGGGKLPSKPADMEQVCLNCLLPEENAR